MMKKQLKKQLPTSFSLFNDWRLFFYNLGIIAISPYLLLYKLNKTISTRNPGYFLKVRCTTPTCNIPENDPETLRIVFICSGFGEKQACDKLTAALKKTYPRLRVISAVRDHNPFNAIRQNNSDEPVTYYPFDFWPFVKRWYQKLNPDVVVAMRLLWLPNIIWASKLWGAPICTIGVPPRQYKPARNKLWTIINRWTLRGYDAVGFLSEKDKQAHLPLFNQSADVRVTGTTRFLQPQSNPAPSSKLKEWVNQNNPHNLPIIIAGSVHNEEIDVILNAFLTVQSQVRCILLIAPRELPDNKNIEQAVIHRNLSYDLRSQHNITHNTPAVLILDSMGELSRAYAFATVAYVGGTLHGVGHNIYEPLEWKVPVFFGPGKGKAHVSQNPALEAGVGFRVNSSTDLAKMWTHILNDTAYKQELEHRCQKFIDTEQMTFQKNLQIIIDMIELKNK